jgi:rhamnosyltransferase
VSVVVPTLNAMKHLDALLPALQAQRPQPPREILIVDSGSTDGTAAYAVSCGSPVRLVVIDPERFSHGRARNLGVREAKSDVVVFLSQDALPQGETWLARLVNPLRDPQVAAAFSRQVPRPEANPMERFFLETHFPPADKVFAGYGKDAELRFQRDVFFSNVSSAAEKTTLQQYPFDEALVMSEDQQFARDLLLAGHAIAYASDSVVLHSHNYSWPQALRRYFDSAYSLTQVFERHGFSSSARIGVNYIRREFAMMARRHPQQLPRYAGIVLARALGTVLGHGARRLPRRWVRSLSQCPHCW